MNSNVNEAPGECADPSSPVTINPAEDAFYAKAEAELHRSQSERVTKLEAEAEAARLNAYYLTQHCRPHARF